MTEVVLIPVDQLIVIDRLQARTRLDNDHVARLTFADPADWPPLLVTPLPDGRYAVIDGAHRLEAGKHLANGKHVTAYPCRVMEGAGVKASFAANASHPLTICTKDRLRFALGIHEVNPKMSTREIGRRVGLAHSTVSKALAAAAGGGSSSGGADDSDEAVVRRVLSVMTKNPNAVHVDDVYSAIFGSAHAAQVYRAAAHWVAVMGEALKRAEAQAAKQESS